MGFFLRKNILEPWNEILKSRTAVGEKKYVHTNAITTELFYFSHTQSFLHWQVSNIHAIRFYWHQHLGEVSGRVTCRSIQKSSTWESRGRVHTKSTTVRESNPLGLSLFHFLWSSSASQAVPCSARDRMRSQCPHVLLQLWKCPPSFAICIIQSCTHSAPVSLIKSVFGL